MRILASGFREDGFVLEGFGCRVYSLGEGLGLNPKPQLNRGVQGLRVLGSRVLGYGVNSEESRPCGLGLTSIKSSDVQDLSQSELSASVTLGRKESFSRAYERGSSRITYGPVQKLPHEEYVESIATAQASMRHLSMEYLVTWCDLLRISRALLWMVFLAPEFPKPALNPQP